jgi:hypothetical protein
VRQQQRNSVLFNSMFNSKGNDVAEMHPELTRIF